jgi:hypothetical protein
LNDINISKKSDGMDEHHHITIPAEVNTQKEKEKDLRLIFSDKVKVQFTAKDGTISTLVGWWCNPCKYVINSSICKEVNTPSIRANPEFTNVGGKRKAFHTGGNSSCRSHIRQHYELYKDLCKQENIPEQHWAIPRSIWKEMEESQREKKPGPKQRTLDFIKEGAPRSFTRENLLHAMTQFIAVDDQVSTQLIWFHVPEVWE